MKKQPTLLEDSLIQVRNILCDLMESEGHDKFVRARLTISLAMINAIIKANNAGKAVRDNIRAARNRTKSR